MESYMPESYTPFLKSLIYTQMEEKNSKVHWKLQLFLLWDRKSVV